MFDFNAMHTTTQQIVVDSSVAFDPSFTVLDLSRFSSLRELAVGDCSLSTVEEVKLMGLHLLDTVTIGNGCFSKRKGVSNPNRHFYLKDCGRLKQLKIGRESFMDYSLCEMENLHSVTHIQIGELYEESFTFMAASLVLKSACS